MCVLIALIYSVSIEVIIIIIIFTIRIILNISIVLFSIVIDVVRFISLDTGTAEQHMCKPLSQ